MVIICHCVKDFKEAQIKHKGNIFYTATEQDVFTTQTDINDVSV